jgi:sterol desaturase/sphingolipid hydroxylase (fatty acid hydroxylase superfamily)
MERRFRNPKWLPGMTMHKIQFYGGIAGAIFTIGLLAFILMGLPEFWSFLGVTVAPGIVFSFAIKLVHYYRQHDIETIGSELR